MRRTRCPTQSSSNLFYEILFFCRSFTEFIYITRKTSEKLKHSTAPIISFHFISAAVSPLSAVPIKMSPITRDPAISEPYKNRSPRATIAVSVLLLLLIAFLF